LYKRIPPKENIIAKFIAIIWVKRNLLECDLPSLLLIHSEQYAMQ
jgi:hypothetical protein